MLVDAAEIHGAIEQDVLPFQDSLIAEAKKLLDASDSTDARQRRKEAVDGYAATRAELGKENDRLLANTKQVLVVWKGVLSRLDELELMKVGVIGAKKLLADLKKLNDSLEALVNEAKKVQP